MSITCPAPAARLMLPRSWCAALLAVALATVPAASVHAQTRGGTLTWAMGAAPETLAPYLTVSPAAAQIGAKIYDGLLEYDAQRQPLPGLADRWQVAADGLTITFQLKRGVAFHDGQPFTSADVRFSILDVLRRHHPRGMTIFRAVTGVRTTDPHTAVLELSEPAPYLMTALAGHESPMLPRHALAANIGKPDRATAPLAPGTGPFKLAAVDRGRSVRLVRNAAYWRQGLPLLDAIEIQFIDTDPARAALLEADAAHVVSALDTETVHRLKSVGTHRLRLEGADALAPVAVLSLNTERWPFDKPGLRQAVSLAIDRQAVIAGTWHGFGRPASGPLPAAFLARDGRGASLVARPAAPADTVERANALLDAAGFARKDDGIRFNLVHDVAPLGPDWQRLSESVELQMAKVGIKVSSRFETIETWMQRLSASGDFSMATHITYGLSDPVIGLHRTLHGTAAATPSPFTNSARWRDANADALMDQARIERDPFERGRAYRALQAIAVEAAPMVWLAELTPPVFVHRKAHGVMTAPLGLYGNFAESWLATAEPPARTSASASGDR